MYQPGDFVASFPKCNMEKTTCLADMEPYLEELEGGKKTKEE
jgi:hypothetical protein